jgi:hypothetical protein
MTYKLEISSLILDHLAGGEMGLLRLIVAVRRNVGPFEKGNLAEIVKCALNKLVASQAVLDVDGLYSLSPLQRQKTLAVRALDHRRRPLAAWNLRHP